MQRYLYFNAALACIAASLLPAAVGRAQETDDNTNVVVKAEELPTAYGAPPDVSHGRLSTLTKAYVLAPFSFELENEYEGDAFEHRGSRHIFAQELELGLPARLTVGLVNELERSGGDGGERSVTIEARYALADWNKIPLNPALSAQYRFGLRDALSDSLEVGLLVSHDFPNLVEWALNAFVDQQIGAQTSTQPGFAQSVEVPVLLPDERLEIGLEMQYRQRADPGARSEESTGFVIGPTLAWRPSQNARLDLSSVFGCTNDAPRVEVSVVFSLSFGGTEAAETEAPVSMHAR